MNITLSIGMESVVIKNYCPMDGECEVQNEYQYSSYNHIQMESVVLRNECNYSS